MVYVEPSKRPSKDKKDGRRLFVSAPEDLHVRSCLGARMRLQNQGNVQNHTRRVLDDVGSLVLVPVPVPVLHPLYTHPPRKD